MGLIKDLVPNRQVIGEAGADQFVSGTSNPIGKTCVRSQDSAVAVGDKEPRKRVIEKSSKLSGESAGTCDAFFEELSIRKGSC
jgi:hypothetical protein